MTAIRPCMGLYRLLRTNGEYILAAWDMPTPRRNRFAVFTYTGGIVEEFDDQAEANEFFTDLIVSCAKNLPEPDCDSPLTLRVTPKGYQALVACSR